MLFATFVAGLVPALSPQEPPAPAPEEVTPEVEEVDIPAGLEGVVSDLHDAAQQKKPKNGGQGGKKKNKDPKPGSEESPGEEKPATDEAEAAPNGEEPAPLEGTEGEAPPAEGEAAEEVDGEAPTAEAPLNPASQAAAVTPGALEGLGTLPEELVIYRPLTDYLPTETVGFVALHDLAELRRNMSDHAWNQFFHSEELAPLRTLLDENLFAGLLSGVRFGDGSTVFDPETLLADVHSMVFFFGANQGRVDELPFGGVVVRLVDEPQAFHPFLDWALGDLGRATPRTDEPYAGGSLSTFGDKATPGRTHAFRADGFFAMVASDEGTFAGRVARDVAARHESDENGGGVTASNAYQQASQATDLESHVELFVDFERIWKVVEAEGFFSEPVESALDAELKDEVRSLRWLHAGARVGEGEDLDLRFSLHVPSGGWMARVADLFGTPANDLQTRVPANATGFGAGHFDFQGLFELVFEAVQTSNPEEYTQLLGGLEMMRQSTGVDLMQDIVGRFTGEFLTVNVEVPAEESPEFQALFAGGANAPEGGTTLGTTVLLGLSEPGTFERTLDSLLEMVPSELFGEGFGQEQHGDHLIHSLEFDGTYEDTVLEWAFTEDALAISFYASALRGVLARYDDPTTPGLLDDVRFNLAVKENKQASVVSVTDTQSTVRAALSALSHLGSFFGSIAAEGMEMPGFMQLAMGVEEGFEGTDTAGEHFEGTLSSSIRRLPNCLTFRFAGR